MYVLLGIWNQNSNTEIYEKCCSYLSISIFSKTVIEYLYTVVVSVVLLFHPQSFKAFLMIQGNGNNCSTTLYKIVYNIQDMGKKKKKTCFWHFVCDYYITLQARKNLMEATASTINDSYVLLYITYKAISFHRN